MKIVIEFDDRSRRIEENYPNKSEALERMSALINLYETRSIHLTDDYINIIAVSSVQKS